MESVLSAESLPELLRSALWALLGFSLISFFVGCYLFEILAQKLDAPRWMAWVPLANLYLALELLGWGKLFWLLLAGYALAFAGALLPPPISMLAGLAIIPTALALIVISFVYWPMLARRRGLPVGVGLLLVLPQLALAPLEFVLPETLLIGLSLAVALVGFGAFLWIVFHDGGPEAPPHLIAYPLTGFAALVGIVVALKLPVWLEQSGAMAEMQTALRATLEQAKQEAPDAETREGVKQLASWVASLGGVNTVEAVPVSPAEGPSALPSAPAEPAAHPVADTCPSGGREAGARPPRGREWWCEVETSDGWLRHGPARSWIVDYRVAEEGEYRHGQRHGTWTLYWRTGGRRTQAEFRDGAQHGWMHRWDEAGRLESQAYFQDGEPAPLAAPSA